MRCINFDKEFERYVGAWMKDHAKEYRNYDEMEAAMPDVYAAFLDTPVNWLSGNKPGEYFAQFDNAHQLVNWMEDYFKQRSPVPDMLLNRIAELGLEAEESLMTLLTGYIRKKDYSARVSFHQYGYRNTEVTVPLERLIDCCLAEGCTPYVGIESQKDDSVVATLFLVNAPLGYAHTFQFTVNPAVLDRTDGVLKARGYLYTPLYSKKS